MTPIAGSMAPGMSNITPMSLPPGTIRCCIIWSPARSNCAIHTRASTPPGMRRNTPKPPETHYCTICGSAWSGVGRRKRPSLSHSIYHRNCPSRTPAAIRKSTSSSRSSRPSPSPAVASNPCWPTPIARAAASWSWTTTARSRICPPGYAVSTQRGRSRCCATRATWASSPPPIAACTRPGAMTSCC